MPFILNDKEAQFLVADKSEATLTEYIEFYQGLADYYGGLPLEDRVFGPAEDFFRVLRPEEFDFAKNVEGGIATKEPGLDMALATSILLRKLGQLGVRIETGTQVRNVRRQAGKFVLNTISGDVQEDVAFDQVINAGGYKARLLDAELGDQTQYNLYLKAWNLVLNKDGRAPLPPFYVVRGDFMHHSPFGNDGLISLITATKEGSYLGTMQYGKENPQLPPEWIDVLDSGDIPGKAERQRTIIEYACDEFLRDSHFTPVDLIPGVAVSFSASRQDRTRRGANQVVPGWQTIVPTKVTNALELAREARKNALHYSTNKELAPAAS